MVLDDAGRQVQLDEPATRIVSLAPHVTELLFFAGAGNSVVGVSQYSTWPEHAADLPSIGGGAGLDLEAILALKPDLVVAWESGNSAQQLSKLEQLGVTIFYSEPRIISDIPDNLERLGMLAGTRNQAHVAAEQFRSAVKTLRQQYKDKRKMRVFYQIWEHPLMTINGDHLISRWLELCGAQNVFSDLPDLAPVIDKEAVLEADPEVIVAGSYSGKGLHWRKSWQEWPQLYAVKHEQLIMVPAETMERQTPRALQAVQQLCEKMDGLRN